MATIEEIQRRIMGAADRARDDGQDGRGQVAMALLEVGAILAEQSARIDSLTKKAAGASIGSDAEKRLLDIAKAGEDLCDELKGG
jgi:hypothetical protein